ncbi:nuclear transport factor 2 family protein [Aeromonas hydrophila]|uniref:nuclear transport factor 2 family protein n=1 Tax=Aeromonas hydrophila TaxID=644 RepID=UPI001F4C44C7|nr:nuclear transport factor 2 family protein [Aeromonas hydrophila]MCO4198091.1 nuclear transport factor 2 family protein [Aeromonas hydrophila]UNB58196.1 nuclear transport factor 2 family protein [Aeromonas hydrophila]
MDYKQRLQACFNRVICDPDFTPAELDHWFCPDYVQLVDDQRLDRAAFEQHLLVLRQSLVRCEIRFVSLLAEGNRVHSLHRVRAWRHDGAQIECKVSALFTFQDERLSHTDELTCLLAGEPADRDLGSRLTAPPAPARSD